MNEQIQKYYEALNRIRSGNASKDDIKFFLSYSPEIDEAKMQKILEGGEFSSPEEVNAAIIEAGRALDANPENRQRVLEIAQAQEGNELSGKIAQGINLVLGGLDIANSVAQIKASDKALKDSRRPSRPRVPGRDQLLQQALRQSQETTFDSSRALAPVQQQISDQYLSDIEGAKTAATGQAGSYGAYRQLAANRRNRAALQLAPIQDEIRRGQEARQDNLLGMRMDETQQMFRNQAYLYPYELNQYQKELETAANVGSLGRQNLRGSLYNLGSQLPGAFADNYVAARHNRLRNQAVASGLSPEDAEKYIIGADNKLRDNLGINYRPNYNPQQYFEQSFIG